MNEERAKAPAPDFAGGPMAPDRDAPVDVVDVQFRAGSKIYYFAPGDLTVAAGDHVIIETARGQSTAPVPVAITRFPSGTLSRPCAGSSAWLRKQTTGSWPTTR